MCVSLLLNTARRRSWPRRELAVQVVIAENTDCSYKLILLLGVGTTGVICVLYCELINKATCVMIFQIAMVNTMRTCLVR